MSDKDFFHEKAFVREDPDLVDPEELARENVEVATMVYAETTPDPVAAQLVMSNLSGLCNALRPRHAVVLSESYLPKDDRAHLQRTTMASLRFVYDPDRGKHEDEELAAAGVKRVTNAITMAVAGEAARTDEAMMLATMHAGLDSAQRKVAKGPTPGSVLGYQTQHNPQVRDLVRAFGIGFGPLLMATREAGIPVGSNQGMLRNWMRTLAKVRKYYEVRQDGLAVPLAAGTLTVAASGAEHPDDQEAG